MINKTLTLFMILSFTIVIMGEADLFHGDEDSFQGLQTLSTINAADNCDEQDCHDSKGHCSHHCSGIHNAAINTDLIKIDSSFGKVSKLNWYYLLRYQSLNIDPALRPPTFA
jgi:hypothetical protein